MNTYTPCRSCGTDLGALGLPIERTECCCNNGYCTSCCMEGDEGVWEPVYDRIASKAIIDGVADDGIGWPKKED